MPPSRAPTRPTSCGPAFDAPEYEPQKSIISDKFFLTSAAVFALGWNTTALPGGLQKPADLLDPALKGKIGIVNPSGIASYVDFYRFFEKNFGDDYLQKLAELKPRIYPSALGVAQALTSGEIVANPYGATPGAGKGIGCTGGLGATDAPVGNSMVHPRPLRGTAPECSAGAGEFHGDTRPARRRCHSATRAPCPTSKEASRTRRTSRCPTLPI